MCNAWSKSYSGSFLHSRLLYKLKVKRWHWQIQMETDYIDTLGLAIIKTLKEWGIAYAYNGGNVCALESVQFLLSIPSSKCVQDHSIRAGQADTAVCAGPQARSWGHASLLTMFLSEIMSALLCSENVSRHTHNTLQPTHFTVRSRPQLTAHFQHANSWSPCTWTWLAGVWELTVRHRRGFSSRWVRAEINHG